MSQPGSENNPTVEDPKPGELLYGKYIVIKKLGHGAMGSVWHVQHKFTGAERALKLIESNFSFHPEAIERFRREAQIMAQDVFIEHRNLVPVFDAEISTDRTSYIEMSLVRGQALKDALQPNEPMPLDRAAKIIYQVCDGIQAAHELGIIHRDLKPANLMLVCDQDQSGELVKVLDFGIAKFDGGTDLLETSPGVFLGTPLYASPEQLRGDPLDGRSDIYSIGLILFELLTGRLPFVGRTAMFERLSKETPTFNDINPSIAIPEPVECLVRRCLTMDPANRPQEASDLKSELQALLTPIQRLEPAPDPPRSIPERLLHFFRDARHHPLKTLGFIILFIALIGGIASFNKQIREIFGLTIPAVVILPPPPELLVFEPGTSDEVQLLVERNSYADPIQLTIGETIPGVNVEVEMLKPTSNVATLNIEIDLNVERRPGISSLTILGAAEGIEIEPLIIPITIQEAIVELPNSQFQRAVGSSLVEIDQRNFADQIVLSIDEETKVQFQLIPESRDLDPFYIMRTKVWNNLYDRYAVHPDPSEGVDSPANIMGANVSDVPEDEIDLWPVVNLTVLDAYQFADWLIQDDRRQEDRVFYGTLPTAQQWKQAFGDGLVDGSQSEIAINLNHPVVVGSSSDDVSMPFGLLDMAGNGYEWTRTYRRGGASIDFSRLRVHEVELGGQSYFARRPMPNGGTGDTWFPKERSPDISFRVVIEIHP